MQSRTWKDLYNAMVKGGIIVGAVVVTVMLILSMFQWDSGADLEKELGKVEQRTADAEPAAVSEADVPPREQLGMGALTEEQQRRLFEEILGVKVPSSACDFNGIFNHHYSSSESDYYGLRMVFFSLTPEEGVGLIEEVAEVLKNRAEGKEPNVEFGRRVELEEITPLYVEELFPKGTIRLSLSSSEGSHERLYCFLNPDTGRFWFWHSFGEG